MDGARDHPRRILECGKKVSLGVWFGDPRNNIEAGHLSPLTQERTETQTHYFPNPDREAEDSQVGSISPQVPLTLSDVAKSTCKRDQLEPEISVREALTFPIRSETILSGPDALGWVQDITGERDPVIVFDIPDPDPQFSPLSTVKMSL